MDADTFVVPQSMKNMVRFFKDDKIMSVTPAMLIHKPRTVWQRLQHVEYILGLFLRKAFASVNSIYITPGAFSAYRKEFFDKHGGNEEGNITEDLEMSLRIQYNGYKIGNCPDAPVYTTSPEKFKALMIQRRRWYFGLIKNTLKYRKIIGSKYGDMGTFVMPIAWISIFFAVFITLFFFFKAIFKAIEEYYLLKSTGFDIPNFFNVNLFVIERFFFLFFSNPVILFIIVFLLLTGFYVYYATKKVGRYSSLLVNIPIFYLFFSVLFGFWWIVSIIYALFSKTVKWE